MLGVKLGGGSAVRIVSACAQVAMLSVVACSSSSETPGGQSAAGSSATNPGTAGGAGLPLGGSGAGGSSSVTPPAAAAQVSVTTLRRLNRVEYANTLRDLTGTTTDYSKAFPAENLSFGFDNIGEALTVQPLHVEKYEESAEKVVAELFARPATDPFRSRFLTCDPASGRACMSTALVAFAQYAYRRLVSEAEVAGLLEIAQDFVATGGTAADGLELAFKGVLLSPHFLYRVELDPDPASKEPHRLGAFELASRLSYYLWSTMPDQPLLADAQQGTLVNDASLSAQIERMLLDPRSDALVSNFAGQWLNIRRIDQVQPDKMAFSAFDDELRAAMHKESDLFFKEVLTMGRPVSELLSGAFTYVNARLAAHYGMQPPAGADFVRVDLTGTPRVGVLTQGSFLTLTSNPTRTSPVKRGKWVLDQLLCSPPPPPPPGVDTSLGDVGATTSLRKRLEAHRDKEPCKSCHAVMDPIGLSFENFDGIGKYRTEDQFGPIDATGTLTTASGDVSFQGASQLVPVLAQDSRLAECAAEKVLTYAIGRGYTFADKPTIDAVLAAASTTQQGLRGLIATVASSEPFRSRRAVGE